MMDFVKDCFDEIALDGLDGITIQALWLRLQTREPNFPLALDDNCKNYLWKSVIAPGLDLEFYELPEERHSLAVFNRFLHKDEETGICVEQESVPEDIYPLCIIQQDGVCGSCSTYETRIRITELVRKEEGVLDLTDIETRWGNKFVIVASQKLRNISLFGENHDKKWETLLSSKQYCLIERIGRSRSHGEVTHGKYSLMEYFQENAKTIFYLRKKLFHHRIVKVQTFNQRLLKGINVSGKLLHLNRFFVERKPIYLGWMEKLSIILEQRPQRRDLLTSLKTEMGIKDRPFKKLYQFGAKHFRTNVIPYRDFYPDASPKEYMTKGKQHERNVRVLELIEPYRYKNTEEEEDENLDDPDDPEESCFKKDVSKIDQVIEYPLLHQANQFVVSKGEEGCNQMEMFRALGLGKLEGRLLCRNLEKRGAVKRIMWDEGKQRVQRYVSINYVKTSDLHTKLEAEKKKISDHAVSICDPDATLDSSVCKTEEESMSSSFYEDHVLLTFAHQPSKNAHVTYRMLKRANIILQAVRENKLIDNLYLLQKKIIDVETNENFKHRIDKKSMLRLVNRLSERGQVKSIKTTIQIDNGIKKEDKELHFICDPSISDEDPLVRSSIESAKCKFMAASRESLLKLNAMESSSNTPSYAIDSSKPNHALLKSNIRVSDMEYDPDAGKRMGFLPRMKRVQLVHQFLWYLVRGYGQSSDGPDDTEFTYHVDVDVKEEAIDKKSDSATLNADSNDIVNNLTVYANEVSWRRFLPPLPQHTTYGPGWCLIGDVLLLLPLYMFCQIIRVNFRIRGLISYLNDPVKRNIPVCQLPSYIRQCLMYERKYIFGFYEITRLTAELGLLSYGVREIKEKEQIFIYIHNHGSVVDTTVPPEEGLSQPVKSYSFKAFHDINQYWFTLQFVCLNTPLENLTLGESGNTSNRTTIVPARFTECLRGKTPTEITDIGSIPGDGLGAGGIDSNFWGHLKRNWSQASDLDLRVETMVTDPNNMRQVGPKSKIKPKRAPKSEMSSNSVTKRTVKSRHQTKSKTPPKKQLAEEKSPDIGSGHTMIIKPNLGSTKGGRGMKRKSSISNVTPVSMAKKKKEVTTKYSAGYDAKDHEALKRMTAERVAWTAEEDSMLLLCQVAQVFLCGNRRDFIVNYGVIRDILHGNIEKSKDKTSKACGRRLKYVLKNPQTVLNVNMYVGEAMQDKKLVKEFKTKKYTKTNSNDVVFKKAVETLRQKFKGSLDTSQSVELPGSLEELYSRYIITNNQQPPKVQHKDVSNLKDVYFSVLQNLIHSSMLLNDKIGRAHELYQLYNQYPEELLFEVFTNMKNAGIITKVKKNAVNTPITMGTYQLAQRYSYNWLSRYPKTIFKSARIENDKLEKACALAKSDPNQAGDIDTVDLAGSCILTVSLMAKRKISFRTQIPEQIIVIDRKKMREDEAKLEREKRLEAKRKQGNLTDSEEEEDALIEEAEKHRDPTTQRKQPEKKRDDADVKSQGGSSILFDNRSNASRFLLSLARGQYVTSFKAINPSDHLVVNACSVNIQLKSEDNSQLEPNITGSSIEWKLLLRDWNKSNRKLYTKTCFHILKSLRITQPGNIDFPAVISTLRGKHGYSDDDVSRVTEIYDFVNQGGLLGVKKSDVESSCKDEEKYHDHVENLIEHQVVLEVGVTLKRLVSHIHARPWLIYSYKNLKGRGNLQLDEDKKEDIKLPKEDPGTDDSSTAALITQTEAANSPSPGPDSDRQSANRREKQHSTVSLHNSQTGSHSVTSITSTEPAVCIEPGPLLSGQKATQASLVSPPRVARIVSIESPAIAQQERSQINRTPTKGQCDYHCGEHDPIPLSTELETIPLSDPTSFTAASSHVGDGVETKNTYTALVIPKPGKVDSSLQSTVPQTNEPLKRTADKANLESDGESHNLPTVASSGEISSPAKKFRSSGPHPENTEDTSHPTAIHAQLISELDQMPSTSTPSSSNLQIKLKTSGDVTDETVIKQIHKMIASGQLGKLKPGSRLKIKMPTTVPKVTGPIGNEGPCTETTSGSQSGPSSSITSPGSEQMSTTIGTVGALQGRGPDSSSDEAAASSSNRPSAVKRITTRSKESNDSSTEEENGSSLPQLDGTVDNKTQDDSAKEVPPGPDDMTQGADSSDSSKDATGEGDSGSVRQSKRQAGRGRSTAQKISGVPPPPTGTYQRVRLICRPWRTPEGTVNRPVLKMMLESILLHIMAKPGLTANGLQAKYNTTLQPVPLSEIVELLEIIGCVEKSFIQKTEKPSLFSSRRKLQMSVGNEGDTVIMTPKVDCLLKLSQFLAQLEAHG